jgi:hypothetical protein
MYDESVSKIVEKFKNDSVDFHQTVADMAGIFLGLNAKTINLRIILWNGKRLNCKLNLGLSTKAEAENLFNQYHENVPFRKRINDIEHHNYAQLSGSIGTL